jgi:hypothetical protein
MIKVVHYKLGFYFRMRGEAVGQGDPKCLTAKQIEWLTARVFYNKMKGQSAWARVRCAA